MEYLDWSLRAGVPFHPRPSAMIVAKVGSSRCPDDSRRSLNLGHPQGVRNEENRTRREAASMARANGLFEAHLTVADLDVSIDFYRRVVGLDLAHVTSTRQAAFFWIGAPGQSMLGLWASGHAPQKMRMHVAFASSLDDVLGAHGVLQAAGVATLDFNEQPTYEPVVLAWMPAASIYFRDPDGHLLEYIAMLPDEPRPHGGVVAWHQWVTANGA
jgi:lactoylglutathione lyase